MLAEDDPVKMEMDIIDEQVDTVGRAFMGLTLGCARCHDHKFDPISMADYYSLAGIFKSTKTMENYKVVAMWSERPLATAQQVAELREHEERIAGRLPTSRRSKNPRADKLLGEARARMADYLLAAVRRRQQQHLLAELAKPAEGQRTSDRAIVIEAEAFARGNLVRDFTNYGPEIGVVYNAGPLPNVAEYDVELAAGGTYLLALRYAAAESRPLDIFVDGAKLKSNAAAAVTGSWQPDTQTWSIESPLSLALGKHVLRIGQRPRAARRQARAGAGKGPTRSGS